MQQEIDSKDASCWDGFVDLFQHWWETMDPFITIEDGIPIFPAAEASITPQRYRRSGTVGPLGDGGTYGIFANYFFKKYLEGKRNEVIITYL